MNIDHPTGAAPVRFGVVVEAWKWRFAKPNSWLGITIVAGLVLCVPAVALQATAVHIARAMLGHDVHGPIDCMRTLPARLPVWVCMAALLWTIDAGMYEAALRQQRGEPYDAGTLFSHLRLFPRLLLPALATQAAYGLALALALVWVRWSALYWVSLALEPLFVGPFLFVLPLMVDKGLGVREAATLSVATIGARAPLYSLVNWILQAVVYVAFLAPLLLVWVPCIGPIAGLALLVATVPTPYIAVALLYRDRFAGPEPPPVFDSA